tara:strand:+ start:169 stop:366 length:198 start_codon:yes stop_codon:yes gene_type:complete
MSPVKNDKPGTLVYLRAELSAGRPLSEFSKEWKELSEEDKEDLREAARMEIDVAWPTPTEEEVQK